MDGRSDGGKMGKIVQIIQLGCSPSPKPINRACSGDIFFKILCALSAVIITSFPKIITNQTIYFQEEFQRKIEQEVEHFFNPKTRKRFDEYGLNYCQKYLFIGKPGTGKTSLIKYLAHKYKLDILQMTLSTSNKLPQGKTRKSIVVIEDIDTYLKSLYTEKVKSPDLTQLLNYLDGSQTPSNCLIIMTANNIEGLPDVLFRPGRINKTYEFPLLSKEVFLKIKSEFDIDGEWHDDMSTMTTA